MKEYEFLLSGRCYDNEDDLNSGGKWFQNFAIMPSKNLTVEDIRNLSEEMKEKFGHYEILITNVSFLGKKKKGWLSWFI